MSRSATASTPILDDFIAGKVRHFHTAKKTRFLFQIFYRNASSYLQHLRQIERSISRIEVELHRSMKNEELFQMMELEKSLIYFSTSLKSNEGVLERILRTKPLKMYDDDAEFLEDVIIENRQAMEMSQIYLHILNGMTQAFATIISNNLNIVMKFLASITIIIAIPTMIASFYGMNVVDLPLSDKPLAFEIIFGFSVHDLRSPRPLHVAEAVLLKNECRRHFGLYFTCQAFQILPCSSGIFDKTSEARDEYPDRFFGFRKGHQIWDR